MNRNPRLSPEPEPILRWVFERDRNAITCELDVRANHTFEVCVVPHWDVSQTVIERFDVPTTAMLRHAEIASELRESGWVLTDHVPHHRAPVAA